MWRWITEEGVCLAYDYKSGAWGGQHPKHQAQAWGPLPGYHQNQLNKTRMTVTSFYQVYHENK